MDIAEAESLIAMSNDLILKSQWPRLTINEQRLILYMLALVEKGDDDFKTYKVSVQELGNILGVPNKDLYARFDQATDGLMGKIIRWIEAPYTQDETLRKVTWCSSAGMTKGQGFVDLSFNPHLKPFLLALKGHFTLYELRAVIRLRNHYSLRLYQFLKYNEGMAKRKHNKSIMVPIEWLKEYLDADNPSYAAYGSFRQKVLLPSQKDIHKNTDLLFDFKPVKTSRKVTSLEFFWRHNPDYDQQIMPFMKTPLSPDQAPQEYISDAIGKQLQALGFDDWQKIRSRLTDEDWQQALDDLEYNQKNTDRDIKSPGGWLRTRIKITKPGAPYEPSQPFQKHLKQENTKRERARKQARREAKRKAEEAQAEEFHRILNERITAKIQSLSKTADRDLRRKAGQEAKTQVPHPTPDTADQLDAARQKLESLSKTEQNKVKRKAKAEIQKHLKETESTLSLSGPAGIQVLKNRTLQIVARDYPLESPAEKRYQEQLTQTTERILRDFVRKKYKITGKPS